MSEKVRLFLIMILLGITSGCAGSPVLTVEVSTTPITSQLVSNPFSSTPTAASDVPSTVSPVAPITTRNTFTPAVMPPSQRLSDQAYTP